MASLSVQEPEPEPEPEPQHHPTGPEGRGIVAVVMYGYEVSTVISKAITLWIIVRLQAAEDNEMNLVEGEYIEQIEEVGDGWWSGVGPGGNLGVFPCTLSSLRVFEMLIICFLKLITLNWLNYRMFQLRRKLLRPRHLHHLRRHPQ